MNPWDKWVKEAPTKEYASRRRLVIQAIVSDYFTNKWVSYEKALEIIGKSAGFPSPEIAGDVVKRYAEKCKANGWKARGL